MAACGAAEPEECFCFLVEGLMAAPLGGLPAALLSVSLLVGSTPDCARAAATAAAWEAVMADCGC